jgi:hypothetical protein
MRLNPETEFKPLPVRLPAGDLSGFTLYARGGKEGRDEARDRERARAADAALARLRARDVASVLNDLRISPRTAAQWEQADRRIPFLRSS